MNIPRNKLGGRFAASSIIAGLELAVLLLAAPYSPAQIGREGAWTPRYIIQPTSKANVYSRWDSVHFFGDVGREGYPDFGLIEYLHDDVGTNPNQEHFLLNPDPGPRAQRTARMPIKAYTTGLLYLRAPSAYLIGAERYDLSLELWDRETRQYVATVPLPPPPNPSLPQIGTWGRYYNAGDVDSDGWDDFWFLTLVSDRTVQPWTYYDVVGLVSGQTLDTSWIRYLADGYSTDTLSPLHRELWDDLNKDGYADLIATRFDYSQQRLDWLAFSGADGSTL